MLAFLKGLVAVWQTTSCWCHWTGKKRIPTAMVLACSTTGPDTLVGGNDKLGLASLNFYPFRLVGGLDDSRG